MPEDAGRVDVKRTIALATRLKAEARKNRGNAPPVKRGPLTAADTATGRGLISFRIPVDHAPRKPSATRKPRVTNKTKD